MSACRFFHLKSTGPGYGKATKQLRQLHFESKMFGTTKHILGCVMKQLEEIWGWRHCKVVEKANVKWWYKVASISGDRYPNIASCAMSSLTAVDRGNLGV